MQAPSSEEKELYYFGLPSCPPLVARSSNDTWEKPYIPEASTMYGSPALYPKFLTYVKHPLLRSLWNTVRSPLRTEILLAVKNIDFTAVDIMRIEFKDEDHNLLMISVTPGSLSWKDGRKLAVRCKEILEEHGVEDVHCEIRESVVRTLECDTRRK